MEEGHQMASGSRAWFGVDEVETKLHGLGKCGGKVGDPVGDVMQAGASGCQETAHGGFGAQRFKKFNGAHESHADALALENLYRGTGISGHELELTTGLLEGGNGHGDVV
jgi:hypothetical protein